MFSFKFSIFRIRCGTGLKKYSSFDVYFGGYSWQSVGAQLYMHLSVFPKMQCNDHQQNSLACTFCFLTGVSRKFSLAFCTLCLCMLIDRTNFDLKTSLKYQHIAYIEEKMYLLKRSICGNFKDQKRPRIVPRIHNGN